jgi:hypothetical protein
MVYQISCNQMALSRTDSCDGLEALTPQEWMTSSEWHQAKTKSASGREDIGWNEAHWQEWKVSLDLRASAAFGFSPHRLRIGCSRLISSSSPHQLHSARLLIFASSAPVGCSWPSFCCPCPNATFSQESLIEMFRLRAFSSHVSSKRSNLSHTFMGFCYCTLEAIVHVSQAAQLRFTPGFSALFSMTSRQI